MPSRLPVPNGAALGNIASAIGPGYMQGFQAQQSGIQNQMLLQRYKMMQDALSGSGAFGNGSPQPQGDAGASASPSAPMGGLLGGGQPQAPAQGLLSGDAPPPSAMPIPAPPMPAPAQTASPPAQMAQAMPQAQQSAPAPGGNGMLPGLSTDLYRKALLSDMLIPGSGKTLLEKNMPGYQAFRGGGYLLKPDGSLTQLPSVPEGMTIKQTPNGGFEAVDVPGARQGMAANEGVKQGITGQRERDVSAFKAGLDVKVANETEKRKTFYETGVMPQDYGSPAAAPQLAPNGDLVTPKGTRGSQAGSGAVSGRRRAQETECHDRRYGEEFRCGSRTLDGTEARMVGLAKALQIVESRGLNEHRADIANALSGLPGMAPIANMIMSGKDVAAVQSALGLQTLDILGQLKQINQGTGGKILNSEFTNLLDKQYGPISSRRRTTISSRRLSAAYTRPAT